MAKSNRQKLKDKIGMSPAIAMSPPSNKVRYSIEVEKKLVNGQETIVGCIESYDCYNTTEGGKQPLEREYTSMEEFKKAIGETVDAMAKKVK